MRVVSLSQPAATLTVTRMTWQDEVRNGAGWELFERPAPMVQRWVTFDYACPSEVVGTRIAIAATGDEPKRGGRVGNFVINAWFDEVDHADDCDCDEAEVGWSCQERSSSRPVMQYLNGGAFIPLPLGVVVGSAIVEASYPIVGEHDDIPSVPYVERTDQDRLQLISGFDVATWTDISDQLPFADWSPGRFAWLLSDAAPCQERCPRCWNQFEGRMPGHVYGSNWDWVPCQTCMGAGRCGPVRWVSSGGRLPEWRPT